MLEATMSFCRGMIIASVILASVSSTLPPPLHAQGTTGTIRGIVTRSTPDAPVSGAQVFIVGGRLGSVTGPDGRYTFSQVPPGTHMVRVRALGFQPIEKSVEVTEGQTATADFVVTSSPIALEVVVTGTAGSARKREVGNSISQVKLSEAPEVTSNVSNLISGRMAGVSVSG